MEDDTSARLRAEFDEATARSRARIAELVAACRRADEKATELSGSARKAWQRRVQMMQSRNIAAQAADFMNG
ncbi:MAG TPA: hypothetical protein VHF06_19115 [Pseudonocardiaceae bacterium]|nr:hypothetical protein [Pseudonocardiaceae bacterium]